ncbi:hypothetical protein [Mucilaginibacter ginsenosidivorans]|uniref:PorT family protein n=1 Tax=Mucilaginibacter ginsenosidivorans TaxID=398053 RepID=A0A5B8UUV9_9SPHI|nr:hypothetical protein [Mucilaginibacter ginsenosidivorans]QEC62907.1 hypothetical protein FRZ54_10065 [Mucilaginibacter ginsenosidivorans]
MRKLYLLFLVGLLIPFLSNAQSNYKPGYVVTPQGDTIKGFIDYREWDMTPDTIHFKKTIGDNNFVEYGPNNITFFNVDGLESYQRYEGPISTDATAPDQVGIDRDTSFTTAIVFFKVLEKGKKLALYSYKDKIKERFFMGEQPGYFPKELIFRVTRSNTEFTFRRQISAAVRKIGEWNEDLETIISKADYLGTDILDVFNRINHITKAEYNKSHPRAVGYQLFAGLGLDITNKLPDGQYQYTSTGRHTSVLPVISGGIDVFANPNTRRLLFRFELMIADGSYTANYYGTLKSFNITTFSLVPQVIYNIYNGNNLKLFGGVGLGLNDYVYEKGAYNPQSFDTTGMLQAGVQLHNQLELFAHYLQDGRGSADTQFGVKYLF